jgi:hypothetical protein
VTAQTGDGRRDPVTAAKPAEPVPAPAYNVAAGARWSERDRRLPDDGALAPQHRYPGRIATP